MPAALAAWSLMLVGQYHKFLYTMSHSLLAAIFCPLLLWLMVRLANERRLRDYVALGVVLGLGLLSKFLFLAAVVAAVIAAFCVRPARRSLLDLRSVVAVAVASAIFLPFVINGQEQWSRFTTVFWVRAGTDQALGFFTSLGNGIWSLSTSIGEYGLALAVVAGLAILWARRGPLRDAAADVSRGDELRFVGYMMLASAALVLAAVLVVGVTIIKPRFVHIFLFPLPILVVALVARGGSGTLALRRYGVLLALVGAGILAVRTVNSSPLCLSRCEDLVPFGRLAKELAAAGFERGTIFAHGVRLGGNLVLQFPGSRVDVAVDPFVPAPPPAGRRGQCLVVWEQGDVAQGALPAPLIEAAGIPPDLARARTRSITLDWRWHGLAVVDPIKGWRPRHSGWHYILLPDGTERCR
jgi:4-amino-4-deoxy-L-arabinose transferase-like glycosyltransferase